jgi:biofilm PGA synthesis N-glycosyltransferase PgaC
MRSFFCKKTIFYTLLQITTGLLVCLALFLDPAEENPYFTLKTVISFAVAILIIKYVRGFFFMNVAPWYTIQKHIREKRYPSEKYKPAVSVIIPAYNEEVGLLNTVKSILQSNYKKMELIVVNDGSTDGSHAIMSKFSRQWGKDGISKRRHSKVALRYFYKKNEGKGKALNYGISKAAGDIIITIDADCAVTPKTMGNFIKPFADPQVSAAVGHVQIGNKNSIVGVVQYLEFLFSFYFKKAESVMGTIYIIGGAAGAFRKELIDDIGAFNEGIITEDIELSVRIQKAGRKVVYVDDAMVYTEGASDIFSLAKQRTRWKRGWFQTFYRHPELVFSKDRKHNKILCWFILPFVFFVNGLLLFEPFFILLLYVYSCLIHDFSSFLTWICVESAMFVFVFIFEKGAHRNVKFLMVSPIGWLLFYVLIYVEFHALIHSIMATVTKKEVVWQKWQRKGVTDDA